MRFVQRPDTPPDALSHPAFQRMRQDYLAYLALDPRRRRQTRPPDRHLPRVPDLDEALRRFFHDKCAFCESRVPVSPYRFRPTSDALPMEGDDGREAYGWLADAWQNLYTICNACRTVAQNHFPVAGPRVPLPPPETYADYAEDGSGRWPFPVNIAPWAGGLAETPLLLDPCMDSDLSSYLRASADGTWTATTPQGAGTMDRFRLNRPQLVASRLAAAEREGARMREALGSLLHDPLADLSDIFPAGLEFTGFLESLARSQAAEKIWAEQTPPDPIPTPVWSDPPFLTRVEIKGFKGLEDLSFDLPVPTSPDDPAPALLILGENAAGKSSILEAIALTLSGPAARKALVPTPQELLLNPLFMGGTQATFHEGLVSLTLQTRDGKRRVRRLRLDDAGLHGSAAIADLPVFAYGAYRHYLRDYLDWRAERGIVSLFRSDNLLSNPEKWLISLGDTAFDDVVAALRSIFGPGGGFERIERAGDRCMVVTRPEGDMAEAMTPLSSVSSGFRTILALTCDVMRWLTDPARGWRFPTLEQARGIVLIDEVEAHLHPRWKVQIMEGLRKALPNVTFIATTHDPLCLRGMKPGEVMVLRRVPGRGKDDLPVKVEQLAALPDMTRLTIEQVLKSDFFALYDTDDPTRGAALAELADALAVHPQTDGPASAAQADLLRTFGAEVEEALPVGKSEVSMLVQDAVAEFIRQQGRSLAEDRVKLRDQTRQRIVAILSQGRDPGSRGQADAPG
jgi:hypothetical protein